MQGTEFDPWSERTKVPHALEQLSPHAETTELQLKTPLATAKDLTAYN